MESTIKMLSRLLRKQGGFTLIEWQLPCILSIIGVVFLRALDTNARATRQLEEKVTHPIWQQHILRQ
jgi:hypothetical protein